MCERCRRAKYGILCPSKPFLLLTVVWLQTGKDRAFPGEAPTVIKHQPDGVLGDSGQTAVSRAASAYLVMQTQRTPGHSVLSSLKWHLVRVDSRL